MHLRAAMMIGLCFVASLSDAKGRGGKITRTQAVRVTPKVSHKHISPKKHVRGGAYTADWIAWDYWNCDVAWNQYCDDSDSLEANPEWDACIPFATLVSAGKGGPLWAMALIDHNVVRYRMYVKGSWNAFDRWGSHLYMKNIGMKVIERGATLDQRKAAGCVEAGWHNLQQHMPRTNKAKRVR